MNPWTGNRFPLCLKSWSSGAGRGLRFEPFLLTTMRILPWLEASGMAQCFWNILLFSKCILFSCFPCCAYLLFISLPPLEMHSSLHGMECFCFVVAYMYTIYATTFSSPLTCFYNGAFEFLLLFQFSLLYIFLCWTSWFTQQPHCVTYWETACVIKVDESALFCSGSSLCQAIQVSVAVCLLYVWRQLFERY